MNLFVYSCCDWYLNNIGIANYIAAAGYAVYAMDHPGFGLSDGLHGYISDFDEIVDNVIETHSKIKGMMLLKMV